MSVFKQKVNGDDANYRHKIIYNYSNRGVTGPPSTLYCTLVSYTTKYYFLIEHEYTQTPGSLNVFQTLFQLKAFVSKITV